MRCEQAQPLVSAAVDGEPADGELERHLAGCAGCTRFLEQAMMLRGALRLEPVAETPDVAPRVLQTLRRRPRRRWLVSVAATFVTAFAVGAVFIGLGRPQPVAAADLPSRLLQAQDALDTLTAGLRVTEGGRVLTGSIAYRAPESLAITLRGGGEELVTVVDEERAWTNAGQPLAVSGREPFSAVLPAPLDVVLPVDGFRLDGPDREPRDAVIDGRSAIGVDVPAAQLQTLLDGLRRAGRLREIHPADEVELWLDARHLVPLRLRVLPADSAERRLWAVRRGYDDPQGGSILEVVFSDVVVNGGTPAGSFPAAPQNADLRDAGFAPGPVMAPEPAWLPAGMRAHRTGVVTTPKGPHVEVRTWTDGRSWVQLRTTREWAGQRLFGDLGEVVRPVDLGGAGTGYVGAAGRRLALHADGLDVELAGSVAETDLLRIAASLPVVGREVPAGWAEAEVGTLEQARAALPGLLLPDGQARLEGFDRPSVRVDGELVTFSYAGPGSRSVVLAQAPGDRLSPPLEPDVTGIEVRGAAGRFTPALGELEWLEDGLVVSLRSSALSSAELLAIADDLAAP